MLGGKTSMTFSTQPDLALELPTSPFAEEKKEQIFHMTDQLVKWNWTTKFEPPLGSAKFQNLFILKPLIGRLLTRKILNDSIQDEKTQSYPHHVFSRSFTRHPKMAASLPNTGESGWHGIGKAPFIVRHACHENVDEFLTKAGQPHDVVFADLSQQLNKYRRLESRLVSQRDALKSKLPEIEKTLEAVQHLKANRGKGAFEVDYEFSGGTFATASVSDVDHVCLWIGADCLVEYPIEEAIELLTENSDSAKTKIQQYEEGLNFLQEQVVITQVSMARIHNWAVVSRRKGVIAK